VCLLYIRQAREAGRFTARMKTTKLYFRACVAFEQEILYGSVGIGAGSVVAFSHDHSSELRFADVI
jgi:hypothetical protein